MLSASPVSADATVTLSASYTLDGITQTASKSVTITGKAHGCAGAGAGGGFFGLLLVGIMARRRVARRGLR
jgi:hypothetical protein